MEFKVGDKVRVAEGKMGYQKGEVVIIHHTSERVSGILYCVESRGLGLWEYEIEPIYELPQELFDF